MCRYVFSGFPGAVGRLEKPFKTRQELENRIARPQTASVTDINLLCVLECPGKGLGLRVVHVQGFERTYIEYLTQIVTVDLLEHIGLGESLFETMDTVSNAIMTFSFNH